MCKPVYDEASYFLKYMRYRFQYFMFTWGDFGRHLGKIKGIIGGVYFGKFTTKLYECSKETG
jgi:hypothetical protein